MGEGGKKRRGRREKTAKNTYNHPHGVREQDMKKSVVVGISGKRRIIRRNMNIVKKTGHLKNEASPPK